MSILVKYYSDHQNPQVIIPMIQQPKSQIKLPELQPYNPFVSQTSELTRRPPQPGEFVLPALSELLEPLVNFLSKQFQTWKIDQDFQFQLPESQFDHKRDRPIITYLQAERIQDEGMVAPLTPEQLQGIKTDGTFTVNSRRYAIPYKWQINSLLQLGSKKRLQNFQASMGVAFDLLYTLKQVFNLRQMATSFLDTLKHIVFLHIGLKSFKVHDQTQTIQSLLQKQRQKTAYQKYWAVCEKALFQYLQFPQNLETKERANRQKLISERQQKIYALGTQLTSRWISQREKIIDQLEEKFPSAELKEQVKKRQREMFLEVVQENTDIDDVTKAHIVHLLDDLRLINNTYVEKQTRISEAAVALNNQIRADFPIKSRCWKWFNTISTRLQPQVHVREQKWMLDQLKRRITVPYFQDYVTHCQEYSQNCKRVEQRLGTITTPDYTFYESYPLFAPYPVSYSPQSNSYYIKTRVEIPVTTDKNFWRFQLFWIRLITWSRSSFYGLVRSLWNGSYGLRVLFESRKFYPEYELNTVTGELGRSRSSQKRPIYVGVMGNLRKIKMLRNEFDNAPDSGLFNKRTARFFHLFKCYFIILFCQTILALVIVKPLLITLNILLSIVLIVTIPVWVPLLLLFLHFYQINIYNYESFHSSITEKYYYNYYNPPRWFMMLRLTLSLVGQLILVLLRVTIVPLVMLFLAVVAAMLGYMKHGFRTAYDAVMFGLIKAFARSPVTDSGMAWKIAGPGISDTYYQSIKSTDIYVLVLAELEKLHLQSLRQQIYELLQKPQQHSTKLTQQIHRQLTTSFHLSLPKLNQSISFYQNKLNKQISHRIQNYPMSPGSNVRFTEEQMLSYTKITKQMLVKYLQKHPHLNFYKLLQVRKQNQDKLVKKIWERIFRGSQVFQILNSKEMRFDAMKESEECDEVHRLADLIRKENADDADLAGLTGVNFAALTFEDELINMMPEDSNMNLVVSQVSRVTQSQLPSSKQDVSLSVILNANIPTL